jgi:acyl-CoA synthetase (AMP-forming)/AMP-acid ligase II
MSGLTLPDFLRHAARAFPHLGIYYVREDGTTDRQLYPELLKEAESLAFGLQQSGYKAGDKAMIATESNRETINCLWACFLCGIIPTILQPPVSLADDSPAAVKMKNVFYQLDNPLVISSKSIIGGGKEFSACTKLFSELPKSDRGEIIKPSPDDLAFIQFSSGSTGEPKGILLTHQNLKVNMNSIATGLNLNHQDNTGNWMPLYHDMGLIGYHLTPIFFTHSQYHIETIDFIKNPSLWLDTMSNARISVTGCPNFGLALVLRHLKRKTNLPEWDFSSMKAMLNGAEPISVKIMEDFTAAVNKFHFPQEAMMPVYGMAEATLAISFTPLMQPSVITCFDSDELDRNRKAVKLISPAASRKGRYISGVGIALNDISIRIVDESDVELPEGNAGNIQIKGPSITSGYFKNPEATENTFCGEWLRTGDIGFFFEGNLYISGRFKDIIFMNGKNYFANDLENLACSLDEISYGKVAFGGITDHKAGKDKIIIFAAGIPESKAAETLLTLRALFRKTLGIPIDELVILRSNEFPKTSSGKIQRYKILQRYQQGDFSANRYK